MARFLQTHGRQLLHLAFLGIYLASVITKISVLNVMLAIFLLLLVGQAVFGASSSNQKVAMALFTLGGASLAFAGAPVTDWLTALTFNAGLVALFVALPLFSFLLYYEDYQQAITDFFQKYVRGKSGFNILTAWLSFILGAILNLAGIHMLYHLLEKNAGDFENRTGFYQALVRGNLAGVFWAPNFMSVAVVLQYVHISWLKIAPLGVLLSVIMLVFISLLFIIGNRRNQTKAFTQPEPLEFSWKPLFHLLLVYVGLIFTVSLFNIFTPYKILTIVPLVALIYPLLLALIQNKMDIYLKQLDNYYHCSLLKLKNEVLLFASVGFFGKALDITGIGAEVSHYIPLEQVSLPALAVFMVLSGMGILSMVGIHPVVSISALAATIGYNTLGVSPQAYAYTLLLGYAIAVMVSPFSGMSLVMSGLTGENPWNAVPRLNILFALAATFLYSVILPFI
ncbi:MAG: hypothetical protein JG781_2509 [Peptococcaceae bacterium]|jgi:hypothetical protein|nr:hypothetical protein [Peptococcaceae bacterium]